MIASAITYRNLRSQLKGRLRCLLPVENLARKTRFSTVIIMGDEVPRKMAQILRGGVDELNIVSRLRKSDIIARYGGEEFVIILPETGKQGAVIAAELSAEDEDHTEIIKNADYTMYKAKNLGRNQVVVYPSDEDQS